MKKISRQLNSLPKYSQLKFTSSKEYLEGKNKLSLLNTSNVRQKSVDNIIKIFESKTPEPKNFLTSDLLEKISFKQALRQKKRKFGFADATYDKEKPVSCKKIIDNKKKLNLLINNRSAVASPQTSKPKEINNNKRDAIKSASPKYAQLSIRISPKDRFSRINGIQDKDLTKAYQESIKKTEIETGLIRVRLSKLLSIKPIFNNPENIR